MGVAPGRRASLSQRLERVIAVLHGSCAKSGRGIRLPVDGDGSGRVRRRLGDGHGRKRFRDNRPGRPACRTNAILSGFPTNPERAACRGRAGRSRSDTGFEGEGEFLFPEAPGASDREGGFDSQALPRLECPVAVFLEELETGQIECHAWDASGEEYLEYSWEPVGSTTRNWLDNPRLFPEDSPTPSVIAPEAPAYETLESFLSGETTLRYRYRLTATSRATGLSSSQEVEVYVSSSRPVVYCPLEVSVEEGEAVTLDCEGADPLSFRMDYDEEAASALWEWEGLWGTSTAPLAGMHLSSPLFTAPAGSAGEEYHYIASMTTSASGASRTARRRVTVKVVDAEDAGQAAKANAPSIECEDAEIYEATENFALNCTATDAPDGATYSWTGTDIADRLSATTVLTPTFYVPDVEADTDYDYTVTMSASGADNVTEDVTVTVKNKPDITVTCMDPAPVYEGAENITLACEASGAPGDDPQYTWLWSPTTYLTDETTANPAFAVPPNVNNDTTYTYTVTATVDNANDGIASVTVKVRNVYTTTIHCPNNPYSVDEGSGRHELDCRVENPPTNISTDYQFISSSSVALDLLDFSDGLSQPWYFTAPASVDADTTYKYTLIISIAVPGLARAIASRDFSITVRDTDSTDPSLTCTDPSPVYEGAAEFALDCSVENEPSGATYAWEARGSTSDTDDLNNTTILTPTFDVPPNVDADTDYDYTVTLSASGISDITEDVTVTVKNKPDITVTCTDPSPVYEGAENITLACEASGAPGDDPQYTWSWSPTTYLTNETTATPTFDAPEVDRDTTYTYTATASSENAEDGAAEVTVTVRNGVDLWLVCVVGYEFDVNEGSRPFRFGCLAAGADHRTIRYVWTPRGNTPDVSLLDKSTEQYPLFRVPGDVPRDTTFEYLLTVSSTEVGYNDRTAEFSVRVRDRGDTPSLISCAYPSPVYEGSADIELACEAPDAPADATYRWTGPDVAARLKNTDSLTPTFTPPASVYGNTDYQYKVTMQVAGSDTSSAFVVVTVLEKPDISSCIDTQNYTGVKEGTNPFRLTDCSDPPQGAPGDHPVYRYRWTTRGITPDSALDLLSSTQERNPLFTPPPDVQGNVFYEYLLTISADNADDFTVEYSIEVIDVDFSGLGLVCENRCISGILQPPGNWK